MNVKMFLMVSGVEVIARVVEETDSTVTVEKAYLVQVVPSQSGTLNIGMAPFCVGVFPDGEVVVKKSAIMTELYNAPAPLEKRYIEQTSGIQLAD